MNPIPASSPRLACRTARFWSALSGGAPAHLAHCPDCQRYLARADSLDAALRREAAIAVEPPLGFEQRLLRAVHQQPPLESRVVGRGKLDWIGAGALAAAAALAVVVVYRTPNAPAPEVASNAPTAEEMAAVVDTLEKLPDRLVSSAISVRAQIENNSLQEEMNRVAPLARNAVRFLEINFLPKSSYASVEPNGRR